MTSQQLIPSKVTICIPNYKTLEFTKLCLRSIRKYTQYPCDVIVVDNDSKDESLQYLRTVPWIKLIELKNDDGKLKGAHAEGTALDKGLENCCTEFFVAMHSDTFAKKQGWLKELVEKFNNDPEIVCVGSGKVELESKFRTMFKAATDYKTFTRKILRTPDKKGIYRHHNRTVLCLYRTEVLKREKLTFMPDLERKLTSGKKLYFDLVDRGYKTVVLSATSMGKYIMHLAHATQLINPAEFKLRQRTVNKCNRLIRNVMSSDLIQNVLNDDSLDK